MFVPYSGCNSGNGVKAGRGTLATPAKQRCGGDRGTVLHAIICTMAIPIIITFAALSSNSKQEDSYLLHFSGVFHPTLELLRVLILDAEDTGCGAIIKTRTS